jgi:hypothetical protein
MSSLDVPLRGRLFHAQVVRDLNDGDCDAEVGSELNSAREEAPRLLRGGAGGVSGSGSTNGDPGLDSASLPATCSVGRDAPGCAADAASGDSTTLPVAGVSPGGMRSAAVGLGSRPVVRGGGDVALDIKSPLPLELHRRNVSFADSAHSANNSTASPDVILEMTPVVGATNSEVCAPGSLSPTPQCVFVLGVRCIRCCINVTALVVGNVELFRPCPIHHSRLHPSYVWVGGAGVVPPFFTLSHPSPPPPHPHTHTLDARIRRRPLPPTFGTSLVGERYVTRPADVGGRLKTVGGGQARDLVVTVDL